MKKFILAALVAASLTGCAGLNERQQRVGSGALIGAGVGAAVGGRTGAAIGAIGGAVVGNEVDSSAKDKEQRAREEQYRQDDFNRRFNQCRRNNSERTCRDLIR